MAEQGAGKRKVGKAEWQSRSTGKRSRAETLESGVVTKGFPLQALVDFKSSRDGGNVWNDFQTWRKLMDPPTKEESSAFHFKLLFWLTVLK